jgi:Fe-S oxidoreductase
MDMEQKKESLEDVYAEDYIEKLKETVLDAARRCRNCNFCFTVCPLFVSTRELASQTPSGLMQSAKYAIKWDLFEGNDKEAIRDLLYLCTTCNSCVLRCKSKSAGVAILDAIKAGRKILTEMAIGPLPNQRKALKDIYLYGNPYGERPEKRLEGFKGLDIKTIPPGKAEVLYYVGCTTAYEPALHHIGKSLFRLFSRLKIDFGILNEEVCCGEPARRVGDEALFQEMMNRNLAKFGESGVKTVVTVSPHCFNTFLNEYSPVPAEMKIQHYTEFLCGAFKVQKPVFQKEIPSIVTYHDPCYLVKHNQVYEAPRELIKMIPGVQFVEMKKNRDDSLCCGGGGGRMYAEVEDEPRLAEARIGHALDVGANVIATACPWCYSMLRNAVQDLKVEDRIRVRDIAEMLDESITG